MSGTALGAGEIAVNKADREGPHPHGPGLPGRADSRNKISNILDASECHGEGGQGRARNIEEAGVAGLDDWGRLKKRISVEVNS